MSQKPQTTIEAAEYSSYDLVVEIVCGIDEAGRGPLAGPVTAAAVVLEGDFPRDILADSKELGAETRKRVAGVIFNTAKEWSIGWSWPEEIDRWNIHRATLFAMKRAFSGIACDVDLVLVDGRFAPAMKPTHRAVVKGDSKIHEIMAASIIAKYSRDRWMERYSWIETDYGFEKHKGYPTRAHRNKCTNIGPSAIQRHSFKITPPSTKD